MSTSEPKLLRPGRQRSQQVEARPVIGLDDSLFGRRRAQFSHLLSRLDKVAASAPQC